VTWTLPERARSAADYLASKPGTYLQSVVRASGVTCDVCAEPLPALAQRCSQCVSFAGHGVPLADRVASMIYAVQSDSQAYKTMHDYKARFPGDDSRADVANLLRLGLVGHTRCALVLSEASTHGWTVVPSTRGRTILRSLVLAIARNPEQEVDVQSLGVSDKRELRPDLWQVTPRSQSQLPDHVIVIDDAWVSGRHAQSLAAALKAAGVKTVSVFTVARVLNPKWAPTGPFIAERLRGPSFDPARCPWTGGSCP
jgi:hypothetical protein